MAIRCGRFRPHVFAINTLAAYILSCTGCALIAQTFTYVLLPSCCSALASGTNQRSRRGTHDS
jgi:hypothetical protein